MILSDTFSFALRDAVADVSGLAEAASLSLLDGAGRESVTRGTLFLDEFTSADAHDFLSTVLVHVRLAFLQI